MDEILDIILDSLIDAAKDTVYIIPFLLITYVIMECIEHKLSTKSQASIKNAKYSGPLFGAIFGIIPQCGFSACASAFYAGRVITIGTLFAVYLSTSDEMLPVFIAGGLPIEQTVSFIGVKFLIGLIFGFLIDAVLRKTKNKEENFRIHELCKRAGCKCCGNCEVCKEDPNKVYEAHDQKNNTDNHNKENKSCHKHNHSGSSIIKSTIIHTLQTTAIIFFVTFALNIIIIIIGGNDVLAGFVNTNKIVSVALSTLVGATPNCAASVVIAQLYVDEMLGFGATLSGLLMSAGLGYIILFQSNRPLKDNFLIILSMYIISLLIGIIISVIIG